MCLSEEICIYSFILPFSRFLLMCTFGTRHHQVLEYAAILLSSSKFLITTYTVNFRQKTVLKSVKLKV